MTKALQEVEIETRALRPTSTGSFDETPNDNLDVLPGTVGPITATPGDPNGVEVVYGDPAPPFPPALIRPSAWTGWPDEWMTPLWNQLENLTDTAWTCLDLNASIFASMPPYLVNASSTLPSDWLINPDTDQYTGWSEFAKQAMWDYQSGEVFVLATAHYANNWPARFHVVSPWNVSVEMQYGTRRYYMGGQDVTDDLLHVRYQSRTDDPHGHGPLEAGRSRLIAARVLTRYGTNIAISGGIPNSVIIHPDELTDKQAIALQNQWIQARISTMGLPAVLSGGVTFETLQLSPKDMALIDLLQFNEARIAVLLGVPPFLVALPSSGDPLTYSTIAQLFDFHWRSSLKPKSSTFMEALSGWLTPRGTKVEVNRDSYVQPGPLERAQTWQILIDIGVVTAEQVQQIERYSDATSFVPMGVL